MRRAFALPVSAAVLGALLAIGVSALNKANHRDHARVHVIRDVQVSSPAVVDMEVSVDMDAVEADIAEAMEVLERVQIDAEGRLQGEFLTQLREQVRTELESAIEAEELTAAERERIQEAMEQLEAELPLLTGVSGIVDGITREDGAAHPRDAGN